MNKINPLQRPLLYQDDNQKDRGTVKRSNNGGQAFQLDQVEISKQAREVQKASQSEGNSITKLSQDASIVGSNWYLQGYILTED